MRPKPTIGLSVPRTIACSVSTPSQAPALLGSIAAQAIMSMFGILGDDLADAGRLLEPAGDAEIERVLRLDAFLHVGHQPLERLGRIVRHRGALELRVVVEQIDGAARGGDEADARPLRQPAAVEGQRRLHHVVEVAAIVDAVALAHREIGGVVAADRAGVRLRGGLRLRGGAGLDRDDRLAGFERARGRRHEGVGPADALDEQRDHACVFGSSTRKFR